MDWCNIKEAAKMCGVKVRTVRQWIRDKKIAAKKADNGWYWLISKSELEAKELLNDNKN